MTLTQFKSLPALCNRFSKDVREELERINNLEEEGDEIDQMIMATDSHVSVAKMKAVARLN